MNGSEQIQINHSEYQKRVKTLTVPQLMYIIKDCKEAIAAYPENPKCGYYQDEIHYAAAELRRRQNGNCGR